MPISSDSWGNHLLECGGNHYELVAVTMRMFPGKWSERPGRKIPVGWMVRKSHENEFCLVVHFKLCHSGKTMRKKTP